MEGTVYQIIWFILWAVLWTGYFVLDGFDLGAGILFYLLGKNEEDKRLIYSSVGSFWDTNEVWLITAGGATFAAFPKVYAVMFSSFYSALLLLLFCLIFRGVAIEYRNKVNNPVWKTLWDLAFSICSFLAVFLLGVAFANIFEGIPIDAKGIFHGTLFSLLNPYGLLGGITFVLVFAMHGANWIAFKNRGTDLEERARNVGKWVWALAVVMAVIFLFASYIKTSLWENYMNHPILVIFPLLSVVGFFLVPAGLLKRRYFLSWIGSGLGIIGFSAWGFAGLFPNMLPSSLNPAWNLTCFNASSSPLTLKIMTVVAFIFVPIMLLYKIWTYIQLFDVKEEY